MAERTQSTKRHPLISYNSYSFILFTNTLILNILTRFHTLYFICLRYKQNYIPRARVCNYYLFGYSFFMAYNDSEHEFEQLVKLVNIVWSIK